MPQFLISTEAASFDLSYVTKRVIVSVERTVIYSSYRPVKKV
jgi:hypothetical protein